MPLDAGRRIARCARLIGHNRAPLDKRTERMNLQFRSLSLAGLTGRIRGMFNLNDRPLGPRRRRRQRRTSAGNRPETPPPPGNGNRPRGQGPTRARPTSTNSGATSTASSAACSAAGRGGNGGGIGGGGGGGGFQPDMKSAGIGARPDRRRRGADLAGHRLLHRAGRPAGRDHAVRPLQDHRRRRLQLAPAVSDPAPRDRGRHADPLGRRRPRQRSCAPPACASRPC